MEVDVSSLKTLSDTPPEEALGNIEASKEFDIDPDSYKNLKSELEPELESRKIPSETSPIIQERMVQSEQHTSVYKQDLERLNWFERHVKFMGETLKGKSVSTDLFELTRRKAWGEELSEEEETQIALYNYDLQELNGNKAEYDYNFWESVPAEVLGAGYDFANSLKEGADLTGKGAAIGATGGAILGSPGLLPGALLGAKIGALKGAALGTAAGQVRYATRQGIGQIYNDISNVVTDGVPISESEKRSISRVGGLAMGAISILPVKQIAKRVPWINKIVSPRAFAKYMRSMEGGKLRQFAINMGKSGLVEAFEEGSQEAISIVATTMGETWDGTETSFIEGMNEAARNYEENLAQVGKGATIGFIAGTTISGTLDATGRVAGAGIDAVRGRRAENQIELPEIDNDRITDIVNPEGIVEPAVQGTRAVQLMTALQQQARILKDSTVNQRLTEDIDAIKQKNYEIAGTSEVWVTKEDLNTWANTEERAQIILNLLDGGAVSASDINSPIRIETHKFVKVIEDHPDIAELSRPAPEAMNAKEYAEMLNEAEATRQVIIEETGITQPEMLSEITPEVQEQINNQKARHTKIMAESDAMIGKLTVELGKVDNDADRTKIESTINRLRKRKDKSNDRLTILSEFDGTSEFRTDSEDVAGEGDYLSQPTFTDAIAEVVPAKEILDYNETIINTRVEIADAIRADRAKKMEKVVDVEQNVEQEVNEELARGEVEKDFQIDIVEGFLDSRIQVGDLTDAQKERKNKGLPIYSINPSSLPEKTRVRWEDDPKLKERNVFSEDGIDVNEATTIYGVSNAEKLLTILSKTPTRKEQIEFNRKKSKADETEINANNETFTESDLAKAYDNMTKIHLQELKTLLNTNWSTVKKGIRRIALPLPKIESLQTMARDRVGSTKVKNLNANQYKVAERKSQRKAVTAVLRQRLEEAFREKTNAALNTQLSKETHIAIGKSNRAMKFIASLGSTKVQSELSDAGKSYVNAVNLFLDAFNFDPTQRGQSDIDSYNRFIKKMVKEGHGDLEIPQEVQSWLTPQESAKEMSVDQLLWIESHLKTLVKMARTKNKLMGKYGDRAELTTTDIIAEAVAEQAKKHSDYNEKRLNESVGTPTLGERVASRLSTLETFIKNNNFIAKEWDDGYTGGFFYKLLHEPLQGTGQHSGPFGKVAKAKLQGVYKRKWDTAVKKYYTNKEFRDLDAKKIEIPEFKGTKLDGKLSKYNLLGILVNMGNAENKNRLTNFDIDIETIMTVLKRELSEKDFDFVQEAIWDTYSSLVPRVKNVHEATGTEVEFVKSESFEAFGKTYKGGYYPIRYKEFNAQSIVDQAKREIEERTSNEIVSVKPRDIYEGLVRSPHTKERVGSDKVLDLDLSIHAESLNDVLHDVTMRVPVRDTLKLLSDKTVRDALVSIAGKEKYVTFVNNVAKQTNSMEVENMRLHRLQQNLLQAAYANSESAFAINFIAFNPSSVTMSTLAIPQILSQMGISGAKYLAQASLTILSRPHRIKDFYQFASEGDPSLTLFREGIDDYNSNTIDKFPKKGMFRRYRAVRDGATELAFRGILGGLDTSFKTVTYSAAYTQYLNGDAMGHSWESIYQTGKTKEQIDTDAKTYASGILESTTMRADSYDKAVLQNLQLGRLVTRFWNEMRNSLNNRIQDVRNIRRDSRNMVKKAKEGDFVGANIAFDDAGSTVARMLLLSMLGQAIINSARGFNNVEDEELKEEEMTLDQQMAHLPGWMFSRVTTVSGAADTLNEMFGQHIPLVRDMMFSAESGRGVSLPAIRVATDVGQAVFATPKLIYQSLMDEATLLEASQDLTQKEFRAIFNTFGYLTGGFPVSATMKLYNLMEERAGEGLPALPGGDLINQNFLENIDGFLKRMGKEDKPMSDEDLINQIYEEMNEDEKSKLDDFDYAVENIKEARNKLRPLPQGEPLTDRGYEIIKHAESNGKWNASPSTSGAFGLYQFTPGTWRRIMNTPEGQAAGLTERGRLSKMPKQQEKAMRILTKMNMAELVKADVPVDIESIYFAHHFGASRAKEVYGRGVDSKAQLSSRLLSPRVLKANPRLVKDKIKTVADMKRYIQNALERGMQSYEGGNSLDIAQN